MVCETEGVPVLEDGEVWVVGVMAAERREDVLIALKKRRKCLAKEARRNLLGRGE